MIVVGGQANEVAATPAIDESLVLPRAEIAADHGDPPAVVRVDTVPGTDFGGLPLIAIPTTANPDGSTPATPAIRFMVVEPSGAFGTVPLDAEILGLATDAEVAAELQSVTDTVEAMVAAARAELDADVAATNVQVAAAFAELAAHAVTLATLTDGAASINVQIGAHQSAIDSIAGEIVTINSSVAGANAAITIEAVTRASAIDALTAITTTQTANIAGNTAAITAEGVTRAAQDSALSVSIATNTANIGTVSASVTTETAARISQDSILAASISTNTTNIAGNSASISVLTASVNGLATQWAVQATLNGTSGHLEFSGLQRADGTGAVFVFDILSNVNIHGTLVVDGTIVNGKIGNEQVTVVRGTNFTGSTVNNPNVSLSGTTTATVETWTFSSGIAGDAVLQVAGKFAGDGDGPSQVNIYMDGTLIFQNTAFDATPIPIGLAKAIAITTGSHTLRIDMTVAGGDGSISDSLITLLLGSK